MAFSGSAFEEQIALLGKCPCGSRIGANSPPSNGCFQHSYLLMRAELSLIALHLLLLWKFSADGRALPLSPLFPPLRWAEPHCAPHSTPQLPAQRCASLGTFLDRGNLQFYSNFSLQLRPRQMLSIYCHGNAVFSLSVELHAGKILV